MTQSAPSTSTSGDRPVPELVRGIVEAVNEKGIRVAGQWCNYSRYAEVPRPDVGQWVELVVKNRFITGLKLLGPNGAAPLPEPGEDAPRRAAARRTAAPLDTAPDSDAAVPACGPPPWLADGGAPPGAPRPVDGRARREHVISRLAVLKAAADFLARRPDAVPDDVLTVAIQWLVWVEEDDRAPAA